MLVSVGLNMHPLPVNAGAGRVSGLAEPPDSSCLVRVAHGQGAHHGETSGNPKGGTAAMVAAPLAAIDLPLKLLVREDDEGAVWMSDIDSQWLAERYGLAADSAAPLPAAGALAGRVAAHTGEK